METIIENNEYEDLYIGSSKHILKTQKNNKKFPKYKEYKERIFDNKK